MDASRVTTLSCRALLGLDETFERNYSVQAELQLADFELVTVTIVGGAQTVTGEHDYVHPLRETSS
jgi:hypothetical protein